MARRALITGVLGQDGAYLAQLLLERGYEVFGLYRDGEPWRLQRLGIADRIRPIVGDVRDQRSLEAALRECAPTEVYNLAALSSVRASFVRPLETGEVTGLGALRLLDAVRKAAPEVRFYQASSSEMFGGQAPAPQTEDTPFAPVSPYAVAKVYAHQMTVAYREAYGLFACCGILFNHESPLRGAEFVTRKIARAAAAVAAGRQQTLTLGNTAARRDFGYAPEYVEAMWRMLQRDTPSDFVVATGEAHSIREFAEVAFAAVGLELDDHLVEDPALLRPNDVDLVVGDARRAREILEWRPTTTFDDLVGILVDAECLEPSPEG